MDEPHKPEASLVEWKEKLKGEVVRQLHERSAVLQDWKDRLDHREKDIESSQVMTRAG